MVKNLMNFQKRALVGIEYGKDFECDGKKGLEKSSLDEKTLVFSAWNLPPETLHKVTVMG